MANSTPQLTESNSSKFPWFDRDKLMVSGKQVHTLISTPPPVCVWKQLHICLPGAMSWLRQGCYLVADRLDRYFVTVWPSQRCASGRKRFCFVFVFYFLMLLNGYRLRQCFSGQRLWVGHTVCGSINTDFLVTLQTLPPLPRIQPRCHIFWESLMPAWFWYRAHLGPTVLNWCTVVTDYIVT